MPVHPDEWSLHFQPPHHPPTVRMNTDGGMAGSREISIRGTSELADIGSGTIHASGRQISEYRSKEGTITADTRGYSGNGISLVSLARYNGCFGLPSPFTPKHQRPMPSARIDRTVSAAAPARALLTFPKHTTTFSARRHSSRMTGRLAAEAATIPGVNMTAGMVAR